MSNTIATKSLAERAAGLLERTRASESYAIDRVRVDLAEEIYMALKREGISQTELADRMGKSRQYVSQILAGDENLCIETVAKVARALNCEVEVRLVRRYYETIQAEHVSMDRSKESFKQYAGLNRKCAKSQTYTWVTTHAKSRTFKWEPALTS